VFLHELHLLLGGHSAYDAAVPDCITVVAEVGDVVDGLQKPGVVVEALLAYVVAADAVVVGCVVGVREVSSWQQSHTRSMGGWLRSMTNLWLRGHF
jgi:hypothetical protein